MLTDLFRAAKSAGASRAPTRRDCLKGVSGNWWKGSRFDEADLGDALIDLDDDGSVERQYATYGWVAAKPDPAQATVDQ